MATLRAACQWVQGAVATVLILLGVTLARHCRLSNGYTVGHGRVRVRFGAFWFEMQRNET